MLQQVTVSRSDRAWRHPETVALPEAGIRVLGALLAIAIATAHVADQGGITDFLGPDWLGWAYRVIEVGGVLTALALLSPRSAKVGWAAGVATTTALCTKSTQ